MSSYRNCRSAACGRPLGPFLPEAPSAQGARLPRRSCLKEDQSLLHMEQQQEGRQYYASNKGEPRNIR